MKVLVLSLAGLLVMAFLTTTARGQSSSLYVTTEGYPGGICQYNSTTGAPISNTQVTGSDDPWGIALSGSDLFVANWNAGSPNYGTIGEYTTSGATVNASLITGLNRPQAIAVSGNYLFVTNYNTTGMSGTGSIGEYTTSGATVNARLVTGLSGPSSIAVSGSDLFVANSSAGTIGEYTLNSDGTVASSTPSLVSGLYANAQYPQVLAVSGNDLFVGTINPSFGIGEICEYNATTGASMTELPFLINLGFGSDITSISVFGSDLFIANNGRISEYTTSGTLVNSDLISGAGSAFGMVGGAAGQSSPPRGNAVPEPLTIFAFGMSIAGLGAYIRKHRRSPQTV